MHKVGGQAVIEGVMMRSQTKMAIAVRNPEGKIVIKTKKLNLLSDRMKKWLFVRGIINLVEMLSHGMKALNFSSEVALGEDNKEGKSSILLFVIMAILGIGAGLALFKLLPLWIAALIGPKSNILFNMIDGGVKLFIFIAYIYVISMMKDVKEVFRYHGAEHKSIACLEAEEKLTVENCRKYSTKHPRCGTSFIMIVIVISIIVYVFIPLSVPFWYKLLYRILLLPVIAGVSYEILKIGAKYHKNFFFSLFEKPGIWIQHLTTKEPTDKQIEVALAALKKVL
ncbi:MAG: DUF1385 domain-containing protein [Nanoarchaeota archaeon]|nr:DUF1385 domain-containing protein [Nanoarchaeota archaeon]MCG2718840.1 DUF1385 domain-containing protein [Nanoarchaeota archaeon]